MVCMCAGEFGIVYKGLLMNWNKIPVQGVAVKALKGMYTIKHCALKKVVMTSIQFCTK